MSECACPEYARRQGFCFRFILWLLCFAVPHIRFSWVIFIMARVSRPTFTQIKHTCNLANRQPDKTAFRQPPELTMLTSSTTKLSTFVRLRCCFFRQTGTKLDKKKVRNRAPKKIAPKSFHTCTGKIMIAKTESNGTTSQSCWEIKANNHCCAHYTLYGMCSDAQVQ